MELDGPGYHRIRSGGLDISRRPLFVFSGESIPRRGAGARSRSKSEPEGPTGARSVRRRGTFFRAAGEALRSRVAVESNPAAARDLEANTSAESPAAAESIEVRTADVEQFLAKLQGKARAGRARSAARGLDARDRSSISRASRPRASPTFPAIRPRWRAISPHCCKSGYEISDVHLFDLFPQTFHMETVVRLRRRPMKLPALWIVAAFAAGIELAERWPALAPDCGSGVALSLRDSSRRNFALAAACTPPRGSSHSLAWTSRSARVATGVERAAVPANHVTRLLAAGRLDTSDPLRWRGRLREDPMALPWGQRYEIDLEQVEESGRSGAGERRPAREFVRRCARGG